MYNHEICIDCIDTNNDTYHGDENLGSQQLYTLIRKGRGRDTMNQIITSIDKCFRYIETNTTISTRNNNCFLIHKNYSAIFF